MKDTNAPKKNIYPTYVGFVNKTQIIKNYYKYDLSLFYDSPDYRTDLGLLEENDFNS